jgi:hypothetical protein
MIRRLVLCVAVMTPSGVAQSDPKEMGGRQTYR